MFSQLLLSISFLLHQLLQPLPVAAVTVTSLEIICFTVISPENIQTSFPFPMLAYNGAVQMANEDFKDLNVTIKYVTDPTIETCDDMTAVAGYLVSLEYYTRMDRPNITALVFTDNEQLELNRLAAGWNILMMTTVGALETGLQEQGFAPTWVSSSLLARDGLQKFFLKILRMFKWRTVSFVLDTASDPWFVQTKYILYNAVRAGLANAQPYSWNFASGLRNIVTGNFTLYTVSELGDLLQAVLSDVKRSSRVIMYLGGTRELRILLVQAVKMGMTNGEYVFLSVEPYPLAAGWGTFSWKSQDEFDMVLRGVWGSVMVLAISPTELNRNAVLRQYYGDWKKTAKDVYYFPLKNSDDINFSQVMSFEGLYILAKVLHEGLQTSSAKDLADGVHFASHFRNRSVDILTGPVNFNDKGSRLVDMVLKSLSPLTMDMEPSLFYSSWLGSVKELQPIYWPHRSSAPPNEPPCGFAGKETAACLSDRSAIAMATSTALVLLVLMIISTVVARRTHLRQKLSLLRPWELHFGFLVDPSKTQGASLFEMLGPRTVMPTYKPVQSNVAKANHISKLPKPSPDAKKSRMTGRMLYQGQEVWIAALTGKSFPGTRHFHVFCNMMHGIQTSNINKFLGICMAPDQTTLLLIDKYCHKGSLRDMLLDGPLNKELQKSFVHDLIQGVRYIHWSGFKSHGNLNSFNCLVNQHFVLKIAKLGYNQIRELLPAGCEWKSNLNTSLQTLSSWRPPERVDRKGEVACQKADIYAVGIILCDIFMGSPSPANCDAYALPDYPPPGINRFLRKNLPREMWSCVELCCEYEPALRPTIDVLRAQLFKRLQIRTEDNLISRILQRLELYASELEQDVADRTRDLLNERRLCDSLLEEMLPRVIVERLRRHGDIEPEIFDMVTIYFSDLDGFGTFARDSSPYAVIMFLNHVYSTFDRIIPSYAVYKVETINDSYVVVSGLPVKNFNIHATEIAGMAQVLMETYEKSFFRGDTHLRIGIHSGPIAAGVVGRKCPRYCLFGDTMNTASRMESHGEPGKIHVSPNTARMLLQAPQFHLIPRGLIAVKGKGEVSTFWLETLAAASAARQRKIITIRSIDVIGEDVIE